MRPYRPSNGTSGEIFCEKFCYRCQHDTEDAPCEILGRTMIYNTDDPEYPSEWVQDDKPFPDHNPRCTAFLAVGDDPEIAAARSDRRQISLL